MNNKSNYSGAWRGAPGRGKEMKIPALALIAASTLASSAFADDQDDQEVQDKLDEINTKLDDIEDALGLKQDFPQLPPRSGRDDWHNWPTFKPQIIRH
jgi:hypothetical protein